MLKGLAIKYSTCAASQKIKPWLNMLAPLTPDKPAGAIAGPRPVARPLFPAGNDFSVAETG